MLVKINFKNGNRTVFNADCYDANLKFKQRLLTNKLKRGDY